MPGPPLPARAATPRPPGHERFPAPGRRTLLTAVRHAVAVPNPVRQRILITGASSGLGEGMARRFAAQGRDLALVARRAELLRSVEKELLAAHPGIRVVTAALDVDDPEAVVRVMPGSRTAYGASKAAVNSLAEGIRSDVWGSGIVVTTILPGYIATDMNVGRRGPFTVDLDTGVDALTAAIEREPVRAFVPAWPWRPIARLLRILPLSVVRR